MARGTHGAELLNQRPRSQPHHKGIDNMMTVILAVVALGAVFIAVQLPDIAQGRGHHSLDADDIGLPAETA